MRKATPRQPCFSAISTTSCGDSRRRAGLSGRISRAVTVAMQPGQSKLQPTVLIWKNGAPGWKWSSGMVSTEMGLAMR